MTIAIKIEKVQIDHIKKDGTIFLRNEQVDDIIRQLKDAGIKITGTKTKNEFVLPNKIN